MSLENWILVGTALLLSVAALLAPYVAELLKRRWFAPKLVFAFHLGPPDCHRTEEVIRVTETQASKMPVYYFRLAVTNKGATQARRCEVLLETIERSDAAGRFVPFERFSPVPLVWGSGYGEFIDINPERRFFSDFLVLQHPAHQKLLAARGSYVDWPDVSSPETGLVIRTDRVFFAQPNRLPPGRYRIVVAIYAENSRVVRGTFIVSWSGAWRDTESELFQECVVQLA